MKKILVIVSLFTFLLIPSVANAQEIIDSMQGSPIVENVKYYKTISTINSYKNYDQDNATIYSIEISEEEYNNAKQDPIIIRSNDGYIETDYKKMTTSIYQNGNYYRYRVSLDWKTMPSTRSYDILAIGINPSVRIISSIYFNQSYCFSSGGCNDNGTFYEKKTSSGAGAFFKLPAGSLTKLSSVLYFDVAKNTTATVLKQDAYGDYSHATKTVESTESQSYSINSLGIQLNSSIYNSYDSISISRAIWNGTW